MQFQEAEGSRVAWRVSSLLMVRRIISGSDGVKQPILLEYPPLVVGVVCPLCIIDLAQRSTRTSTSVEKLGTLAVPWTSYPWMKFVMPLHPRTRDLQPITCLGKGMNTYHRVYTFQLNA